MSPASTGHAAFAQAIHDRSAPVPTGLGAPDPHDLPRRFAVHRNTYLLSLTAALAETFPVVHALVGDDFFQGLARAYVRAEPPRSPILLEHGGGFADFIAAFAPAAALPYLADVARLEFARVTAFHAAEAAPADSGALMAFAIEPERLAATRIRLHPSARWQSSPHAVLSLWRAHQRDAATRDVLLADLDPHVAQAALVLREDRIVVLHDLPPGGAAWLDALADGATLGDAFEHALSHEPRTAAAPLLQLLVSLPLVTHFLTPD